TQGWKVWIALIAMMTMVASACGDTPTEESPTSDDREDVGGEEDTNEGDAGCEPSVTVCGADDCGMIDNGCGEELDCGECDGTCEPTVLSCPADSCGMVDNGCGEDLDC